MPPAGPGITPLNGPPFGALGKQSAEPNGGLDLRSANEITGYYIYAREGDIGYAENLLIDSET